MNGNICSYSKITNSGKNLGIVQDYNDMTISMSVLNAGKEDKTKVLVAKKVEEATAKVEKEVDGIGKQSESLPQFDQELQQKVIYGILCLPDAHMRHYISY